MILLILLLYGVPVYLVFFIWVSAILLMNTAERAGHRKAVACPECVDLKKS